MTGRPREGGTHTPQQNWYDQRTWKRRAWRA